MRVNPFGRQKRSRILRQLLDRALSFEVLAKKPPGIPIPEHNIARHRPFLWKRQEQSMIKEMIVSSSTLETKIAILEDDQLAELYIERNRNRGILGNIYKGKVTKVLPGMQSAFVDIGLEKDAFLYVSDFIEDTEEYDKVFTEAEDQVADALEAIETEVRPFRRDRERDRDRDRRPDRSRSRYRDRVEPARQVEPAAEVGRNPTAE